MPIIDKNGVMRVISRAKLSPTVGSASSGARSIEFWLEDPENHNERIKFTARLVDVHVYQEDGAVSVKITANDTAEAAAERLVAVLDEVLKKAAASRHQ